MATSATNRELSQFDHFFGAALAGQWVGVAENSGSAAIVAGVEGGVVGLITGTTSGNRAQLVSGRNLKTVSGSITFKARVKSVTAITTRALFIGLTDSVSQENPIEIGAGDVVTSTATDAVGFVFDTDATTDKWFVAGVKNDTDTTLTAVNINGSQVAPVADVYDDYGITVSPEGHAEFFLNGVFVARIDNCVTPTVLLTPVILIETRTSGAATAYADFADCEGTVA